MKRLIVFLLAVCASTCGSKAPAAPTQAVLPAVPSCQANHTAEATFKNNGSRVIDVILDGGSLGTLSSGQSGLTRTIAANVAHDIKFKITNTSTFPCASFNPIPVECSTPTYSSCTGF